MPELVARAEPFARRTLPWLLFAATSALTLALAGWSMVVNANEREEHFERAVETFRLSLGSALRRQLDLLPSLRLLAGGPVPIDDAKFYRFAETVLDAGNYPGLTLSFVAELVDGTARDEFLTRVRDDRSLDAAGHPTFTIQPPGQRAEYMPLRHQYPPDPTNDGYDLYDPTRPYRAAVDHAIADGGFVATPPLLLARDRHRPFHPELISIVVRAAIYRGDKLMPTPQARRAVATGVVGVAFRGSELVRSAMPPELARPARVRVTDVQGGKAPPVYDSAPALPPVVSALHFQLPVADRQWAIDVTPPDLAWWQYANDTTFALLVAGFVCAASLTALTAGLARARRRAEARVRDGLAQLEEDKAQLARSETRLRLLFEHSLDGVLNTRPNGGIVAANPAACELLGRTQDELIHTHTADILDFEDPRLAPLMNQRDVTSRARGQLRMRRRDGSTFEAEVSSMIYQDIDGSALASVIVRDLSASLAAAADRQQLEDQLRHAQKMQAVGTQAGGNAHDCNNELAVVRGGTALRAAELDERHPGRAHLERIRQAGLRARTLVQQLLTFGRPPAEGRWAQPLQPLVQEAVSLLRLSLPVTVMLDVKLDGGPLHVITEPTQIQQVLLNLCNNAWQAMPGHQGRIEITLDPATLDGRPWARLSVRDDGAGMSAALRERIFEPFFTPPGAGQGTGLGLSMVHGIVTSHGGRIEVSSVVGHGTIFEIWLPVVEAAQVAPAEDTAPPLAARGNGERIVYVDDDEVLRLTVEALLVRQGYHVEAHAEPLAAVAAVSAAPDAVDLVVTDYNMPQMSGLEMANAMQQLRPDLPVLVVTGQITPELRAAAAVLPRLGVMRKEFVAEQLAGRVAALLARR